MLKIQFLTEIKKALFIIIVIIIIIKSVVMELIIENK